VRAQALTHARTVGHEGGSVPPLGRGPAAAPSAGLAPAQRWCAGPQ
jgi:hypothetical protein